MFWRASRQLSLTDNPDPYAPDLQMQCPGLQSPNHSPFHPLNLLLCLSSKQPSQHTMAAKLFAVTLLALVAVAAAQIQVCDNKLKPSQVPSSGIKMVGSTNSGAYSDLKLEWQRPKDRQTSNGLDSCITSYNVEIVRGDGKTIQSAVVSVSPAHLTANHQFKGLNAGETYKFKINAVGPGGNGPQNGPLGAFATAQKAPVTAVPLRHRI